MKKMRGFTIAETLVALTVLSILAVCVTGLVHGTLLTDLFMQSQGQTLSEVDTAQRRIVYNLRTASAVPTWTTVSGHQTLTITKSGVGSVLYYVDGSGNLVEDDPRYDPAVGTPNTLVHGVTSSGFTCTITAASGTGAATMVKFNLNVAVARPVSRGMTVAVRTH